MLHWQSSQQCWGLPGRLDARFEDGVCCFYQSRSGADSSARLCHCGISDEPASRQGHHLPGVAEQDTQPGFPQNTPSGVAAASHNQNIPGAFPDRQFPHFVQTGECGFRPTGLYRTGRASWRKWPALAPMLSGLR